MAGTVSTATMKISSERQTAPHHPVPLVNEKTEMEHLGKDWLTQARFRWTHTFTTTGMKNNAQLVIGIRNFFVECSYHFVFLRNISVYFVISYDTMNIYKYV